MAVFVSVFLLMSIPREYRHQGQSMGTVYSIRYFYRGFQDNAHIASEIDDVLLRLNKEFSTYIPDSTLSQLNHHPANDPFQVSQDFLNVFSEAKYVYKITNGYYDCTIKPLVRLWGFNDAPLATREQVPTKQEIENALSTLNFDGVRIDENNHIIKSKKNILLDFDSIAKGYAVDICAVLLEQKGITRYMIEIGGEVLAKGHNKQHQPWVVGIQDPRYPDQYQAITRLKISDNAVATSGSYRNYIQLKEKRVSHMINPKTGYPVTHQVLSATIVAKQCHRADALATAMFVMGVEKGMRLINSLPDVEAMLLYMTGDVMKQEISSGMGRYISDH